MTKRCMTMRLWLCALALMLPVWLGAPAQAEEQARNHYALNVELDAEQSRLTERLTLTLINDSADEWSEICLRDFVESVLSVDDERNSLGTNEVDEQGNVITPGPTLPPGSRHLNGSSGVTAARQDGTELSFAPDADDPSIVRVQLARPLAPGQSATVEVDYAADVPRGGYRCARSSLDPSMYSPDAGVQHVTYELGQFYPMLAVYEDGEWICDPYFSDGECFYTRCADYDITLRVPEGYEVIASGDETQGATADGLTEWSIAARNMRDVTLIVSNELDCLSGEAGGVKVNSYYCAYGDKDDSARMQGELSLEAALDALDAFAAQYGDYPYAELDVVESCYEYGGMEAPGLVRISELYSWFLCDKSDEEREYYTEGLKGTVAHEVAHEWFYAVVGNNQYREAWLDESFAAFSEQVYWRAQGRDEDDIAQVMADFATSAHEDGEITVDRSYAELEWDYINAVYKRGAGFLYALDRALGQEKFAEFTRSYYAANAFGETTTRDFIEALEPYIADNADARELTQKYLSQAK